MRFGSLFSGIGGFDLGLELAGLESEWQVENNVDCKRVLTRQWPNVERFDDVTTVGKLRPVDVICGGFPCQDLSVAGKRKGLAGERSGLWFEFLRIIECNKPRWVVIENVPGLLSSDEHRDFAVILRGLVECGYCVSWRVLDAQFYGVAQRRRRVFIVGSLGDGSCAEILFESESVSWDSPPRREAGSGVASTFKSRSASGGWGSDDMQPVTTNRMTAFGEYVDDDTASSLKQRDFKDATDLVAYNIHQNDNGKVRRKDRPNGGMYVNETDTSLTIGSPNPTVIAHAEAVDVRNLRMQPDGTSGTLQHKKSGGYSLNYQNPVMAFNAGQGSKARSIAASVEHSPPLKAAESGTNQVPTVAYTLTNPGSGGRTNSRQVADQAGVRRLTPRECERLQGFPDDFTRYDAEGKEISDSARYRMLGNAVAVPCAEWIGRRILDAAR